MSIWPRVLVWGCFVLSAAMGAHAQQIAIARVEQMPNIPSNFSVIDWNARARAMDAFLYDLTTTGTYRPVAALDNMKVNINRSMLGVPSYVGSTQNPALGAHEGFTNIGLTLGGTLTGIDKTNSGGRNFVLDAEGYYNTFNGENLVLNVTNTRTGQTFWYEILPQLFFDALVHYYPGQGQMETIMRDTANKWWLASYLMGGSGGTPNYDHTAFKFQTLTAIDNGRWKEPDASAGVAWIGYMAYQKFGQSAHLQLANWGLQFLEARPVNQNPYYESQLPWGVLAAARMNAEQGTNYNLNKFMNWCFDTSSVRPDWCALLGSWNGYDVNGLMGSSSDGGGYAFAMNTFNQAMMLVPVVRYDDRYARAIGKWMLNIASNMRHFYRDQMPSNLQSCSWYTEPGADAVPYEGFRKVARKRGTNLMNVSTLAGQLVSGTPEDLRLLGGNPMVLRETVAGGYDQLEHIWKVTLQDNQNQTLYVTAGATDGGDGDAGFRFSYSRSAGGPWTNMFTVTTNELYWWGFNNLGGGGDFYIRVVDTNRTSGNTSPDTLNVDCITIWCDVPSLSPYAMGDPLPMGWGNTDLGIYSGCLTGVFGGMIGRTNNDYILKIDCLKTDMFRQPAYPTYLMYNPHGTFAWVNVDAGSTAVDLYDAVSNKFLARNKTGTTPIQIPADSAVLLVLTPTGKPYTFNGSKLVIDGVIADYRGDAAALNACDTLWAVYP